MYDICERLDKNIDIKLTRNCDMICRMCPNNLDGVCKTDDKVNELDKKVLKMTNLSFGEKIKYKDFHNSVMKNIISCGKLKSICELCEWYYICSKK
ncbi:DUF1284 domain-containing protein [Clostridium sp. BJN0001]|uniref:DUF1284 domain-containing protein n=1 Tax=Clostridium sp. BJN0001 TaxID=2930219 RepID=UPI001FD1038A|nr:DUF1284 domain-containing protein [Clostridium sp. BJN0001]